MSERVAAYAEAMLAVARVEGSLELVSDQLYRFARALEGSDELRDALGDLHLPIDRRLRILEELLGGQAESVTVAVLSMAVAAGRARELPAIIDTMVQLAAAEAGKAVAEIRTAVELSPESRERLADALARATGKTVEIQVVLDPTVLGGIVATIGDTVIDGSVRHRLEQLKKVI